MENITAALAQHQRDTEWDRRVTFEKLQGWRETFDREFNLQIPDVALCVDRLRADRLGHYRCGRNGFGLRGEVAINTMYVSPDRFWRVLGTLLHELVHAWQYIHGYPTRGHHNREFIRKLASLGIIYHRGGGSEFPSSSPFRALLAEHNVAVPPETGEHLPDPAVRAPIAKWSCSCTSVRVCSPRDRRLVATCLNCGHPFSENVYAPAVRRLREC
jgi:hypothetical protein